MTQIVQFLLRFESTDGKTPAPETQLADFAPFALAHGHRKPDAFGHFGTGIAGAKRLRELQRVFHDLLELILSVGKALFGAGGAHRWRVEGRGC